MKPRDVIGLIVTVVFFIVAWIALGRVSLLISAMPYDASPIPPAVKFLHVIIYIAVAKSLLSFHFSWDKCECCGKRYGAHDTASSEGYLSPALPKTSRAKIGPLREGKTLSNVKSGPNVPRPTGSPPPPVRPECPPWRCSACGTIHAAK